MTDRAKNLWSYKDSGHVKSLVADSRWFSFRLVNLVEKNQTTDEREYFFFSGWDVPRNESRFRMPTSAACVPTFIREIFGDDVPPVLFFPIPQHALPAVGFAMRYEKNSWHHFLDTIILYFLSWMPWRGRIFSRPVLRGFKPIVYSACGARARSDALNA